MLAGTSTDHASIATETGGSYAGITKKDMAGGKFMEYAWQWKEKHGDIILQQLKRLGGWRMGHSFAMDDSCRNRYPVVDLIVKDCLPAFVWSSGIKALTAVSEEVYKEVQSNFVCTYQIEGREGGYIT